jgi:DNA-binding response OmpR family regulator
MRKVLIVEDNKVLTMTYQQMFRTQKELKELEPVFFASAFLALEWLTKTPEDDLPAAAILDWMMDGMNGMDLLHELKKSARWSAIPVIMATSNADRAQVMMACSMGISDYIVKPVASRLLVQKLGKALESAPKPAGDSQA